MLCVVANQQLMHLQLWGFAFVSLFSPDFILGSFFWSGHVKMISSPWKPSKEVGERDCCNLLFYGPNSSQ